MSVRERRLSADYQQVTTALEKHPAISIRAAEGNPPERYQIEYRIRGLVEDVEGTIKERTDHVLEIYLTLAYPRQAPQCRMLTPVFHPNIAPHAVCIGDHWAAGESLLSLIVRVGEMLAYQSYNIKSPLNGAAARWAEEHIDELPIDGRDLMPNMSSADPSAGQSGCPGCGAEESTRQSCANGHEACSRCLLQCARCNTILCPQCTYSTCAVCGRLICSECRSECPQCLRNALCAEHFENCWRCKRRVCPDCLVTCPECSHQVCVRELGRCSHCDDPLCEDHLGSCSGCGASTCSRHLVSCDLCSAQACPDCIFECVVCAQKLCLDHVGQCGECKKILCQRHRVECSSCGKPFCENHVYAEQELCRECGGQQPVVMP